jgi:hypothetical protein
MRPVEKMKSGVGTLEGARPEPAPIWVKAHYPWWVRLINRTGSVLGRAGLRVQIDPDAMMVEARRRTGLADFGDGRFRTGLDVLVESFEQQGKAHTFGRIFFREFCTGLLASRLKIQQELKEHPETLDIPLEQPLIVTGLPRSGTTLLHRVLSEDPAGRTLLYWETTEPAPAPRDESYRTDPRIARARRQIRLLNTIAPQLPSAHLYKAEEPEECNNLFAHEFAAGFIGFVFDVPGYVRWLNGQDLVPGYRSMKRQLQILSRNVRADYWVLKAPAHLFGLDALLTVYPDASVVQIHRDPLRVLPSGCNLAAAYRSLTVDPVDRARLGAEYVEAMAVGPERAMKARESADPARFFDVKYESLVADPVGTARAVCGYFGYAFTPEYEARVSRYVAENPQHKHGIHRYKLEDFGLDADTVNREFAAYNAWAAERLARPL